MAFTCSVVVPTLNEEKYLERLLDSIDHQTTKPLEVIVVDVSTDSTAEIARRRGAKLISTGRKGVAVQRKIGFAAAAGDIIISTDADTVLPSDYIATVLASFERRGVAAIFGPVYLYDGPLALRALAKLAFPLFLRMSLMARKPNLNGMNFAVWAATYRQAGEFDERVKTAEDVELAQRLRLYGAIKYVKQLSVTTSGRRITGMGTGRFLAHHSKNYLNTLRGKEGIDNFTPFR